MRLLKMLGLAAITAVAATAFLGAGSASAVTLCKSAAFALGECPVAERYAIGTTVTASLLAGTKAVLLTSLGNVECNRSEVKGKTTSSVEESLLAKIEVIKFEECKLGSVCSSVSVTAENIPYIAHLLLAVEVVREPEDLGGGEFQQHYHFVVLNFKVHVACGVFINCQFNTPELLFHVRDFSRRFRPVSLTRTGT